MGAIATAELVVNAPREVAFAQFIDFSSWSRWMPRSFRALSGPARALREGDQFRIGLGSKGERALLLTVIRLRPNKEICWRGGVPGILRGEHSYFFMDDADKTRVRSEEPMWGLLSHGPWVKRLEREASQVAEQTLSALAGQLARAAKS